MISLQRKSGGRCSNWGGGGGTPTFTLYHQRSRFYPYQHAAVEFFKNFAYFRVLRSNLSTILTNCPRPLDTGGGGVQQQKRQRTSCDFPGGMIFFVLCLRTFCKPNPAKTAKTNKKDQKRQNHDLFCSFLRTHF